MHAASKVLGGKSKKHPGFAKAASAISKKQGLSMESARKILGAGARKASAAAKRRNPRLRRVSTVKK